jgi:anthranilate phosphoribosyltransferase
MSDAYSKAFSSAVSSEPKSEALPLSTLLGRLMRRENLSRRDAAEYLERLLEDKSTDTQIAAALIALTMKGETVEELVGIATAMRAHSVRIRSRFERFIDTAGTGSSQVKTFNVSTATAFVVSGVGVPVAKHGNCAVTSQTGSSDVLSALGVRITSRSEIAERCLNDLGICFMFAPLYHQTTARVAAVRRELGVRTAFNLLGPLTNPAGAPYQVAGVSKPELLEPLALALAALGTKKAWVVHGLDGLDEITLAGETLVAEAYEGRVTTFAVGPNDLGLEYSSLEALACDGPEASARMIREVLSGNRRDAARDLVVANAAAALFVVGVANDLREAATLAAASIDSGAAAQKLAHLVKATNV